VGYASAMAFVFFLVVVAISLVLFALLRRSQR
jgi:ABC-type sugar transport system permease subunit